MAAPYTSNRRSGLPALPAGEHEAQPRTPGPFITVATSKPKTGTRRKTSTAKQSDAAENAVPATDDEAVYAGLTARDLTNAPESDYMNSAQLAYFQALLMEMRQEVLERESGIRERLQDTQVAADPADRASTEEERWLDLRLREREAMLLRKIDKSLKRIATGDYGFCMETGEPIGIPRLLARPTAEYGVDAAELAFDGGDARK